MLCMSKSFVHTFQKKTWIFMIFQGTSLKSLSSFFLKLFWSHQLVFMLKRTTASSYEWFWEDFSCCFTDVNYCKQLTSVFERCKQIVFKTFNVLHVIIIFVRPVWQKLSRYFKGHSSKFLEFMFFWTRISKKSPIWYPCCKVYHSNLVRAV